MQLTSDENKHCPRRFSPQLTNLPTTKNTHYGPWQEGNACAKQSLHGKTCSEMSRATQAKGQARLIDILEVSYTYAISNPTLSPSFRKM